MPFFAFFNENPIKIRDMRVDFYTYDVRERWSEARAHGHPKADQNACILCRERQRLSKLGL